MSQQNTHIIGIPALLFLLSIPTVAIAQDSDGDGLSDFQETHKYFTDPNSADSDADGRPDADWNERREYAYSIRSIVKVMPPITEKALSDDYQDGRVLSRGKDFVELEVVHYPLNTVATSIAGNADWREQTSSSETLQPYIKPGMTTNWDRGMQIHMRTGLRKSGVDVRRLDDRELTLKVASWLLKRAGSLNSSAYAIVFSDKGPEVLPRAQDNFRSIMHDPKGTIDDQFQRELYGRGMYYNEITGSCTSCANYLTTGLRAMGIPTRMVRAIPIVDGSDEKQVTMLEKSLTNKEVAETVLEGVRSLRNSFAAHTYNEVYIGGRWYRLNYTRLGQNIMDEQFMGLMTHIHRYNDLSEAGIGETWGRWLDRPRKEPFLHSNPYRTIEVTDQMPLHRRH